MDLQDFKGSWIFRKHLKLWVYEKIDSMQIILPLIKIINELNDPFFFILLDSTFEHNKSYSIDNWN